MKKKTVIVILGCILVLAVGLLSYIFFYQEKEGYALFADSVQEKKEHMIVADFPYYTFESATAQAEYIFYGKVTEKGKLQFDEQQEPFTEVKVEVLESVKGDFDDSTMKYIEYGGENLLPFQKSVPEAN